jgi:hypothetical protein
MSQIENIAHARRAMDEAAYRESENRHLLNHIGTLRTLLSAIPGQSMERARVELTELHSTLDVLFSNPHDDQEEEIVVRRVQRLVQSIHGAL